MLKICFNVVIVVLEACLPLWPCNTPILQQFRSAETATVFNCLLGNGNHFYQPS